MSYKDEAKASAKSKLGRMKAGGSNTLPPTEASKYANSGISPGKKVAERQKVPTRAKGGGVKKRLDRAARAVHKHEKSKHKGESLTKLKKGGKARADGGRLRELAEGAALGAVMPGAAAIRLRNLAGSAVTDGERKKFEQMNKSGKTTGGGGGFAKGGKVKGPSNVTVNIVQPGPKPEPMLPPQPMGVMPPPPPPMPPMGAEGPGAGAPPPGLAGLAGLMPRKKGGRVKTPADMTAGAASGPGRLEKIELQAGK